MQINHPTTLTSNDYAVLERLMCTLSGSPEPLASLVRRKLDTAVIVHPDASTDGLVTSDRRVRYRINGTREADHLLTWERPDSADASAISLQQPLGLALLGLRSGESISFRDDGGISTAEVTGVSSVPSHSPSQASWRTPTISAKLHKLAAVIKRQAELALVRMQKGRTEATLRRLSDAMLRDIGITRGEIPHVANVVVGLAPAMTTSMSSASGQLCKAERSDTVRRSEGQPLTLSRSEKVPAWL